MEKHVESTLKWNIDEKLRYDLVNFLKDLSRGKVNLGKQVSRRTQVKYIAVLRCPLININKPLNKITAKDTEKFDVDISTDKIKNEWGRPFSQNMKKDMRLALRIFLRWKIGEEKARNLTAFFDTRDIKKTPDYLKESELEKLYKSSSSARDRYLIAVMFDAGTRAEEFLNIRYEDIELPTKEKNFVKITLKEEYSKTKGRTISLYWKHSLEAVSEYIQERQRESIKSQDAVFTLNYDAMRIFLRRFGTRILKPSQEIRTF